MKNTTLFKFYFTLLTIFAFLCPDTALSAPDSMTDAEHAMQRYAQWKGFEKKFTPTSELDYCSVLPFIPCLSDVERCIESINMEKFAQANKAVGFYVQEEKVGEGMIYQKARENKQFKWFATITVLKIQDDYFLCRSNVAVDGSMEAYQHETILYLQTKMVYQDNAWKIVRILKKVSDFDKVFYDENFILDIVKKHKNAQKTSSTTTASSSAQLKNVGKSLQAQRDEAWQHCVRQFVATSALDYRAALAFVFDNDELQFERSMQAIDMEKISENNEFVDFNIKEEKTGKANIFRTNISDRSSKGLIATVEVLQVESNYFLCRITISDFYKRPAYTQDLILQLNIANTRSCGEWKKTKILEKVAELPVSYDAAFIKDIVRQHKVF